MVLDLRLSKDWVVVMTTFLFFIYSCLYHPFVFNPSAKIRKAKWCTNEKYIFSEWQQNGTIVEVGLCEESVVKLKSGI